MKKKISYEFILKVFIIPALAAVLLVVMLLPACRREPSVNGGKSSVEAEAAEEGVKETVEPGSDDNGQEPAGAGDTEPTNVGAIQESILAGFDALMEIEPAPDKLLSYIDANFELVLPETMAALLEKLEYVQKAYIDKIIQYLFEGKAQQILMKSFATEEEFTKENAGKIQDETLRDEILKVFNGGFKFVNLEGAFYPIIDFEFLKKYSSRLTQEYNEYLQLRAEESNKIYSRDAALMISWDEIAARMINTENYLVRYLQDSPRRAEAGELFLGYFSAYIYGQNNTPTRDYSTNRVFDEVIQSYRNTIANNPGSKAASIISKLLLRLENNKFILDEELLGSLGNYINELIKTYGLDASNLQ